jgi:hypothetical protein
MSGEQWALIVTLLQDHQSTVRFEEVPFPEIAYSKILSTFQTPPSFTNKNV